MEPVERDGQLRVFRELLADAVAGRGRILLVSGGVGSGRTELLTRFTELAYDAGARVLTAAGSWAEKNLDLALVEQLFHTTELDSPELPPALAGRARSLVLPAEPTIQQADARLIRETCAVLLAMAREDPLVIVIDDLQFADPASLRTLLYLQRRVRSVRVLLVFAEVAQSRPVHAVLHDELNRRPGFRHVRLEPLTHAGVGELLARRLGTMTGARLAESCHRLSGGSPLLVHALADDQLAARSAPDADLEVGTAYGLAVLRCLRRGDGRSLRLAQGLAVLDEFATPARLSRLLDLDPDQVSGLLWGMTDAGLLADSRFRHPVASAAVLRDLRPEALSALRARAGWLLHEDGVGVAAVARYLTGAVRVPEPWAFPVLRAAAAEALSRNDVRHAVECLELAGAGRADDCAHDRDSAAITAQLVTDAEADMVVRALVWQGRTDDAAAVLASLDGDPCAWLYYAAPHLLDTGVPPSVVADEPDAAAIDDAERLLQSCRIGETPLEDVLSAVQALTHADRGDRAAYWCDELLAEAAAGGTTVWQAVLSDAAASVSLRRGDLVSARRLARAALDLMPAASWGVVVGSPLAHLLTALTRLGRFDEAEEVVRSGLSPAALRTTFGLRFLQARGELHLVTGRLRAALGDFLAVGELALAFTDLSRTYQELGRDDQAKLATRRARQLSDACEMPEPVAESPAAASVLSAAERRVANLAALGHTNREISRMLHVTISTVEQHLTRTYRKLNIHRRTDLPLVT